MVNRKTKTISERALKHIRELEEIKRTTNKRAIICYVIQRNDVKSFEPSACDPIYKSAVDRWKNYETNLAELSAG